MASVCVGCGLDVDVDGKLIVDLDPGTTTQINHLTCGVDGLTARQKRKTLRRSFTATGQVSVAGANGFSIDRDMNLYGTVEDNGTAAGLWTLQGDGSILINVEGVYLVSQQTLCEGTTGQIVGGRARVIEGAGLANIICTSEFNDRNAAVSLAVALDGPEWSASAVRHLQAADVISYISNLYTAVLGQSADYAGEFTITYLGEFA